MAAGGRAEHAADALLDLVLDGTFPPGSMLPSEAELAGRFEVSRLTVREAIRTLASTNVIKVSQGRSSVINPIDEWSALDPRLLKARGEATGEPLRLPLRLLEARRVVEVAIAELAAERRTEKDLITLRETVRAMQEAHAVADVDNYVEADLAFHAALFAAADNAFLEALVQPLASVVKTLRTDTSSVTANREHAIEYHGRILQRVTDHDLAGAREDMRMHLTITEAFMETAMARH